MSARRPVVTGLFVYPVKSCAGTALDSAQLGPRGIEHDREFMLVDEHADFLTQREVPRLALITPTVTAQGLQLSAPGMPSVVHVPLVRGDTYDVVVWRDRVGVHGEVGIVRRIDLEPDAARRRQAVQRRGGPPRQRPDIDAL